jgi:uncharacterized protein YdhG (YjbR/CyaY superfamily)
MLRASGIALKRLPTMNANHPDVDAYISLFPGPVQAKLSAMRRTIRKAAPEAEECISYRMPAYRLGGMLVYFAAFRHHIGFYPTASGIRAFKRDLVGYKQATGSVQFPLDRPLPLGLVARIVRHRVRENLEKKLKPEPKIP